MNFQFVLIIFLSVIFFSKSKPISENKKQKRQDFADLFGYNGNYNSQPGSNTGYGNYGFNTNLGVQSNNFGTSNQLFNTPNSQTNGFGVNSFENSLNSNKQFNNFQTGAQKNQNQFNGFQNNAQQSQNNFFGNSQNSVPQNQNQFNSFQNNPQQNQNNQFGNFQNNQGYVPFYGMTSKPVPVIDPIVMPFTTRTKMEGTTNSNDSKKSSNIPVFTIEAPKDNFSKSFDPYFGMTTRKIPKTPQAYWFSRYYGFTAPIAAIPFSNYNRI